ncbi:MAG: hypothetical protein Q9M89_02970 [Persephonella sp.]|nr:hypothetical protein [Persephonella sp.]
MSFQGAGKDKYCFSHITDILREADAVSKEKFITGKTVRKVIKDRRFRLSQIEKNSAECLLKES